MLLVLQIINLMLLIYIIVWRYLDFLYVFQLEKYKPRRFINWLLNHVKMPRILFPLFVSLVQILFLLFMEYPYWFVSFSTIFHLLTLPFLKRKHQKVNFVYTHRIKRFLVTTVILISLLGFGTYQHLIKYYLLFETLWLYFTIFNVFVFEVVFLIYLINEPLEKGIQKYFLKKAKRKLSWSRVDVIGVTGSFGKTSTKTIIAELLNQEFFVCQTPKSYNTPMGISLTINRDLQRLHQIFVCEMGATQTGDIKELVDLVNPKIGIITEIGPQHLDSFCNLTNIIKTKFELIENLPKTGLAILNYDNRFISGYTIKNPVRVIKYGIDHPDVDYRATNIQYGATGSSFDVVFPNQKSFRFHTKLLGKHNIYNLLAGIVVADYYQIDVHRIKYYLANLQPIEHRLELKTYANYTIIDDSFNANLVGFKQALDVLSHFSGPKIIITPGLVDLGPKQYEMNYELASSIAKTCDFVVLIGLKQTEPIYDGLMECGFSKQQIYRTNQFRAGYDYVLNRFKFNFTLLIENDLPDQYAEV